MTDQKASVSFGRQLLRNTGMLMGTSLIGQAAFALLFVVMARANSPAELGTAMACYGVCLIIGDAADFGSTPRTLRDAAARKIDDAGIQNLFDTRNLLVLGVALLWLLSTPWTPLDLVESLAVAVFTVLRVNEVAVQGLLQSNEQFLDASRVTVAERAMTLLVGGILIFSGCPAVLAFFAALSTGALTGLLLARSRCRRAVSLRIGFQALRQLGPYLAYGKVFALSGLITNFLMLDAVIITVLAGAEQAGFFAIGARLTGPFGVVSTSLGSALTPRVSAVSDRRNLFRGLLVAAGITLGVTAVALGVVFLAAGHLVDLLFGSEYTSSVVVVRAYALAGIVVSATQPLASYLQASGRATGTAWALTLGVSTHLALVAYGSAVDGAAGAARGYLFANLLVLVLLGLLLRTGGREEKMPEDGPAAPAPAPAIDLATLNDDTGTARVR
ncbi:hypothetical protein KIH74_11085 [Kineosporia sp. J2-2]|uniref:O-antigen/teichoic acid export membrane protein n=1 Tax=Kineosporia corallincola TaxID=2835133 RepID=A0ABS5TEF7_9ACTN|nr:hypothetical protein [Kineosporia corallincola]MBT0769467.1 hypothetical protein [Kineosporia corallincola]